MAKKNVLIKISGSLLEKEEVIEWLKGTSEQYSVAILVGGGEQINSAFKGKGVQD